MDLVAIPSGNITLMSIIALICIFGPLIAAVIAALRFKSSPIPIFIGILVYLISNMLVRSPLIVFIYKIPGVEDFFAGNDAMRGVFLAFTVALVEETARMAVFVYFLRKYINDYSAFTYGIGHGGAEVIMIGGLAYVNYYMTAQAINLSLESPFAEETMAELAQAMPYIAALTPRDMLLTVLIEAAAVCMSVFYTFVIVRGARYGTMKICLPLAMSAHFIYSSVGALLLLLPDGTLWTALFSAAAATGCGYYLLEARRRAVMADYKARREG